MPMKLDDGTGSQGDNPVTGRAKAYGYSHSLDVFEATRQPHHEAEVAAAGGDLVPVRYGASHQGREAPRAGDESEDDTNR